MSAERLHIHALAINVNSQFHLYAVIYCTALTFATADVFAPSLYKTKRIMMRFR